MNRVIVIIAALLAFFFIRYLLQLRARRRIPFLGAGTILGGGSPPSHQPRPPIPDSTLDAVERGQYPPPSYPTYTPPPTFDPSIGTYGYPTHIPADSAAAPTPNFAAEPGENSTPAAGQAYLAAELRAAQALLDRSTTKLGGGMTEREVKATKARISELEARQTSAWALGVDSETK